MTMRLGTIDFDSFAGEVLLPHRSTHRYTSPSGVGVGVQVLPPQAPEFTIQVNRFTPAATLAAEVDLLMQLIGLIGPLRIGNLNYDLAPIRVRFAVLDVRVVSSQVVAFAAGHRFGVPYSFSPGGHILADITMQAVPF